jgi:glutathione peroxidase
LASCASSSAWNFEKFVVSPRGVPVARFGSATLPEAAELVEAIESVLPGTASPT